MRCRTVLNTKRPSKPQMIRKTIQWERFAGAPAGSRRLVESPSPSKFCTLWTIGRADRLGDSFIGLGPSCSDTCCFQLVRHDMIFLMSYPQQQKSCRDYAKDQKLIKARVEILHAKHRGKILMFNPHNQYQW